MNPIEFLTPQAMATVTGLRLGNGDMPISQYLDPLRRYLPLALITANRERLCHFLAQLAHESGGFYYSEEIASGAAYEGRRDLGNVQAGDGMRFKGRGLVQLTGRHNYYIYSQMLGVDMVSNPDLAKSPDVAVRVAALYWGRNGLNSLADAGDFRDITRKINGGLNGLDDRWVWLNRFMTGYDRIARTKR